jgi:NADH:ubiquinone oxidoreductase subunit 6 (subunit J)
MTLTLTLFYIFVIMAAGSAIAILFCKNVFKAALWLLVCLLSVAALFVISFAEFVAITQVLIYAGGVLVVILFGIMFTSKLAAKPLEVKNTNLFGGVITGIFAFGLLTKLIVKNLPASQVKTPVLDNSIESIGINLMTNYSLPFEVVGILLLVALVGASVITAFMKLKKS